MSRVLDVSGLLEKADFPEVDIPFFKAHAAMIKRGRRGFAELYSELDENPRLARQCGFARYGYIPSDRSFGRFRTRALPQLYTLRDLLVKKLHGMNALSFRVAAIDGKFKRSNTYAYPGRDGHYSDRDAGLCNKGTYKRDPGLWI